MNSQQLLYINLIIGGVLLLYFFLGRTSPKSPTRLNLRNKDTPSDPLLKTASNELSAGKETTDSSQTKMFILEPETKSNPLYHSSSAVQTKDLAIFFMYNGHDWEAYTVLGVPQGAKLQTVTEAYQKLIQTQDPSSYDFLEQAYQSILKKKRRDTL